MEILKALKRNPTVDLYEITEDDVLYQFEFFMMQDLKLFSRKNDIGVSGWYKQLSPDEKKKVTRTRFKGSDYDDWNV